MKKDLKLQQHLNMINAKLDFLIHMQGKTIIQKTLIGGQKPIYIPGEEIFIKWIDERKNIKPIPKESNQKQDDEKS